MTETFNELLDDTDSIIEEAIEEARKLLDANRGGTETARERGQPCSVDNLSR